MTCCTCLDGHVRYGGTGRGMCNFPLLVLRVIFFLASPRHFQYETKDRSTAIATRIRISIEATVATSFNKGDSLSPVLSVDVLFFVISGLDVSNSPEDDFILGSK